MDSGVEFIATDNPAANRLTLHVLAAVSESEARSISDRTGVALTTDAVHFILPNKNGSGP